MEPDNETPDAAATDTSAHWTCMPASNAGVSPPSRTIASSGDVTRRRSGNRGADGRTDTYTDQGQMVFTVPVELVYR